MVTLEKRKLACPDQFIRFACGRRAVVCVGGTAVSQLALDPGWRWSDHVGSAAGLRRCPEAYVSYVVWGRLIVELHDGARMELGPGDIATIPPGYDAWTVGKDACIVYEFPTRDATRSSNGVG